MRRAFYAQLAELEREIVRDLTAVADSLATVSAAINAPSEQRAVAISQDADRLKAQANRLHAELIVVTARQTPVASDLRLVMAMIELAHHAALIANQFELISQQLLELCPLDGDRTDTRERLSQMSALASAQLRKASGPFRNRDLASARELDSDDDAIDALNRTIFDTAHRKAVSTEEREHAFRYMLIARSLERIGDNAVDVAEQAAFLMTAELREFSDASHPRAHVDDTT